MGEQDVGSEDVFIFNLEARRPACVLLAAAMGGNPEFAKEFDPELWIVDGEEVEGLRRFAPMSRDRVREIAERVEREAVG